MFLSMVLVFSFMIIVYIAEKNIFAVIVCKLLVKKKYQNVILKTALNLLANKGLECLKKVHMLNLKIMRQS